MIRRVSLLCLVLTGLVGCGGGKAGPTPVDVKGTVTLDGKPMPDGDIRFVLEGQAPTVFPVSNGAYSGKANAGKNRVEVRAYRKAAPSPTALATDDPNARVNYLPDRYNSQTTLQAEVKPGAANDFPFTVTSR